jgi:hypothetical protein
MTFEESVQAMLDLLEEDKKWSAEARRDQPKLMDKKKETVVLANVSAVRNQFENSKEPASPTSPTQALPEINQVK